MSRKGIAFSPLGLTPSAFASLAMRALAHYLAIIASSPGPVSKAGEGERRKMLYLFP
jgi:hypothetical protein